MNKQEIEKAIEILKYYEQQPYFLSGDIPALNALGMAIAALHQQLTGGWIPVSERLPEQFGEYRCTIKLSNGDNEVKDHVWYNPDRQHKWIWGQFAVNVIAWQEKPEPYREEHTDT